MNKFNFHFLAGGIFLLVCVFVVMGLFFNVGGIADKTLGGNADKTAFHLSHEFESIFRSDEYELEYRRISTFDDTLSFWLLVNQRPKGSLHGQSSISLWKLNKAGEKVVDIATKSLLKEALGFVEESNIFTIFVREQGGVVLVVGNSSTLFTVLLDSAGNYETKNILIGSNFSGYVAKNVALSNGSVLVGRLKTNPFAMRLDENGRQVWIKKYSRENVSTLTDVLVTDEYYIVLGSKVDTTGLVTSALFKLDQNGEIKKQILHKNLVGVALSSNSDKSINLFGKELDSATKYQLNQFDLDLNLINTSSFDLRIDKPSVNEPFLTRLGEGLLLVFSEGDDVKISDVNNFSQQLNSIMWEGFSENWVSYYGSKWHRVVEYSAISQESILVIPQNLKVQTPKLNRVEAVVRLSILSGNGG